MISDKFMLYFTINYDTIITAKEVIIMPNIKPVSDLRNYTEVLNDISADNPVYLTKNGRGKYVIMDMEDYEKTQATIKLLGKLSEAERSAKENGWISEDKVNELLGV